MSAVAGTSARLRTKLLLLEPEFRGATHHMWRSEGLLPRYRAYLCAMHAVIRASVPLMELALDRTRARAATGDPLAGPLAGYLEEHIREEEGHDAWLLEDLRAAGGSPEDALGPLPSPLIASLVGSQYYWIEHHHPVALLGYIAVLEGYAPAPRADRPHRPAHRAARRRPADRTGARGARHGAPGRAVRAAGPAAARPGPGSGRGRQRPALPRRAHPAVRPARALRRHAVAAGSRTCPTDGSHTMTGPPVNGERPPLPPALYEAGFPVDLLTEEQREVLAELTPEELALLLDVKSRLDAVGPEVQAHGEIARRTVLTGGR